MGWKERVVERYREQEEKARRAADEQKTLAREKWKDHLCKMIETHIQPDEPWTARWTGEQWEADIDGLVFTHMSSGGNPWGFAVVVSCNKCRKTWPCNLMHPGLFRESTLAMVITGDLLKQHTCDPDVLAERQQAEWAERRPDETLNAWMERTGQSCVKMSVQPELPKCPAWVQLPLEYRSGRIQEADGTLLWQKSLSQINEFWVYVVALVNTQEKC